MVADIGDGEKDQDLSGSLLMGESSLTSMNLAKKSTRRTNELTPKQLFEIFEDLAIKIQSSGIEVTRREVEIDGKPVLLMAFVGVGVENNHIVVRKK